MSTEIGAELKVSISTSHESTRKISAMLPGIVFAHKGSIYLKVEPLPIQSGFPLQTSEQSRAVFLKDIEDSVVEVGVRAQVVNPCHLVLFDDSEFGRIVKKASLEVEL